MKYLMLLITVLATTSADRKCSGLFFDDKYYDIDIVKEGINKLHQITINNNDNTIYFIFEQLTKTPMLALGYVNTETKKAGTIDGIKNASSIAIDQSRNIVYVGGKDGLYKLNNKVPESLPVNENIQTLFFHNDYLYFTNKWRAAYRYKDSVEVVEELRDVQTDKLVLDDDNNIFFLDNKKLFRVKIRTRAINIHEKFQVDYLAIDLNGKLNMGVADGVYRYNKYRYVFEKISSLVGLRDLTFDRLGEPVYSVGDFLIRLKYNQLPCYES